MLEMNEDRSVIGKDAAELAAFRAGMVGMCIVSQASVPCDTFEETQHDFCYNYYYAFIAFKYKVTKQSPCIPV